MDSGFKRLLCKSKFHCIYLNLYSMLITGDDSALSCLTLYGKVGDSLYDFLLREKERCTGASTLANAETAMYKDLCLYAETLETLPFVRMVRNYAKREKNMDGTSAYINTVVIFLTNWILDYKFDQPVLGIQNNKFIFNAEGTGTALDSLLFFTVKLSANQELIQRLGTKNIPLTFKKDTIATLNQHYEKFPDLVKLTHNCTQEELQMLLQHSLESAAVVYFGNLYNENWEKDNQVHTNPEFLSTLFWDREQLAGNRKTNSFMCCACNSLLNMLPGDTMEHRERYARDKGVCLEFKKPVDGIKRLYLREVHVFPEKTAIEEHYILIEYTSEYEVSRTLFLDICSSTASQLLVLYELDCSALLLSMLWLGLYEHLQKTLTDLRTQGHLLRRTGRVSNSLDDGDLMCTIDVLQDMLSKFKAQLEGAEITYLSPVNWNFTSAPSKANSIKPATSIQSVAVGRYTRKLPEGQSASENALSLAKKYRIILKEGHTLVDEFERKQPCRIQASKEVSSF